MEGAERKVPDLTQPGLGPQDWDWWWGVWRGRIRCGTCEALMDLKSTCPVCATDYRNVGPTEFVLEGKTIAVPPAFAGARLVPIRHAQAYAPGMGPPTRRGRSIVADERQRPLGKSGGPARFLDLLSSVEIPRFACGGVSRHDLCCQQSPTQEIPRTSAPAVPSGALFESSEPRRPRKRAHIFRFSDSGRRRPNLFATDFIDGD